MKLFGKNFPTMFSDHFFEALCDDTVTLSELDELALTEKTIQNLTSFDKKTIHKWLKTENKTTESLLLERDDRGRQLRHDAKKLEFPIDNSFAVCQKFSERTEYTEDLFAFLRLFLPSHPFILNPTIEKNEDELEQVSNYALILDEITHVDRTLSEIETLWQNWLALKSQLLCPDHSVLSKTTVTANNVLQICDKHLKIHHETNTFSYNLESLIAELNQTPSFRNVAPLYLFKVLVKHKSRLQKNKDITINLASLWKFDVYAIAQDNGRNFNTNRHYIDLFLDLCTLWQDDSFVDIPLSKWGFFQTSNLLEFDRNTTEEVAHLSFPLFDQLLEDSFFSCYRCGGYDAVLLKKLKIPLEKVLFFQSMPHYQEFLTQITEYLHENANELVEKFLICKNDEVMELCMEICQNSQKENIRLTKGQLNLILCAINIALQESVDSFGKEYLIQGFMGVFRGDST